MQKQIRSTEALTMRFTLVALLAGLCAFALATPVQQQQQQYAKADKEFLQKQKDLLRLFKHVNQPSYFEDYEEIANKYNFEKYYDSYTKPEVAKYFHKIYKYGLLPRGEIFSVFYEEHLKQAIALFKLFYYAKDYQTFYETAVWARQHVNEGIFVYALSVAIVHKPETYGIALPPIYEIFPHYFFNSEVIQKAQYYKQVYHSKEHQSENGYYTVNANYSGHYLNLNPEQSLSYYLEDVGLNAFYYDYNIYYPAWLGGEVFSFEHDNRGEQYYYVYQQLLARYYLERLSNGFGDIDYYNWELPFETGYYPSLRYPNGLEFPTRPNHAKLYEYFYNYGQRWNFKSKYGYSYTYVKDYERRIRDAIDKGYIYHNGQKIDFHSENGFNTLGNLIEANVDSPDRYYYGALQVYARHLLGYSYQPLDKYKVAPSALEHYETSMRDPAFYQFYKRIVLYFQKFKYSQPAYEEKDLYFDGVEVKNVEFDRLVTYFDQFYSELSNAVYHTAEEFRQDSFKVRAKQYRLNHKPFTYKVHVNSAKEQQAVVRIYLGPKYDEYGRHINISENRVNFVQFDHFKYTLKAGENVIERNSHQNFFYKPDKTTAREHFAKILGAIAGTDEYVLDGQEPYFGFPHRYLLPKGNYNGYDYQFYVIVSPYKPYSHHEQVDHVKYPYPRVGSGDIRIDGYPYGYPLDRPIYYEQFFYSVPNSYFYDTKIYHRKVEDVNAVHSDQH